MNRIRILGGTPLNGHVNISGAKNAALPLLTVTLLTDEPVTLTNVPNLADIHTLLELLDQHGVEIDTALPTVTLRTRTLKSNVAPYDIVRRMRASFLVLGPLLARHGSAVVSLPGGCAIGTRPVDIHLMGLEKLGASIKLDGGYVHASAPSTGLRGADVSMPMISVGATENLMLAATLATGTTRLINAAREPEIIDLAKCLNAMGAKIEHAGTDTIIIEGVDSLHGVTHAVQPDRIETGTYAMAAAITRGELILDNTSLDLIPTVTSILEQAGMIFTPTENGFSARAGNLKGVDMMTEPFPGFSTDLQAQFMALMTSATGASMITETIFENRFMHVPELCRMGANITVHGSSALVRCGTPLKGAPVMATDIRASVSLVMAGLAAEGETIIDRIYHLDRGYESVENKLRQCGAHIERITGD
ncbi:MAG: UDP-N-acetylglucosamine 1-carboxyvinyltransferase [Alphaproteobacteria bacterium]|nr:UDP-N-acetylglucosamine 1-carboxyvinyltransferase [Alphaproteobacteria bacterium]